MSKIDDLTRARMLHLDAIKSITEEQRKAVPLMDKFYNDHTKAAKKIQLEIQDILRQERFKKAESERMAHVVVKHTSPKNQL